MSEQPRPLCERWSPVSGLVFVAGALTSALADVPRRVKQAAGRRSR